MTINVLSLFAGTDEQVGSGNYVSARMEAIAAQCHQKGIDIIGMQETRHRADHYFMFANYHVLSGPATSKRTGGTQLWIAREAFGLTIDKSHLRTILATDRILVAMLKHPQLHIGLVVLHAPSSDATETLEQWCIKPLQSIPIFALMDANSRVGSRTSQCIGDHNAADENAGGQAMHQWLNRNDMWVPSTFSTHHDGPSETWQHATGARSRIDYIATSIQFWDHEIRTWIEDDIDVELQRPDHIPLRMDIQMWRPGTWSDAPARSQDSGLKKDGTPLVTQTWAIDVNTHANCLEQQLRQGGAHDRVAPRRRKAHLTEDTWTIILAKKACWKQVKRIRRHRCLGFLRTIFGRWEGQTAHQPTPGLGFQPWVRWTWQEEARATFLHYKFAKAATPAIRRDDTIFYHNLAHRAGEVDSTGGIKALWKELKATLPRSLNKKKLNTATQQPEGSGFFAHFDQLEAGEPKSFERLAEQCVQCQTQLRPPRLTSLDLIEFPSRLEVERLCGKVKTGKAPGLDAIDPSLVKANPPAVGHDLFHLMFKMWAAAEEPVSWKGGMLWPIWKGKGSKQQAASYRGVVLLPILGKRWHALLRSRVLPHAIQHRPPMQFGGFPGQQPGFASFIVRGYSARAKMHQLSDACLFLDLRAAFHHLIRHLAMDMGDEAFPTALRNTLDIDGYHTDDLSRQMSTTERLGPLPLPAHLGRLVADLHRFTWYTLAGTPQVSQTHRGTRPGSPFADLGFNAYMGQIMLGIQQILLEDSDLEEAAHIAGLPPTVVGWVDDIAIPICATSPQGLVNMIQRITEQIIQVIWQAGFKVNLDKGKTECLATFRGRGAPQVRTNIFIEQEGKIDISTPVGLTDTSCLWLDVTPTWARVWDRTST